MRAPTSNKAQQTEETKEKKKQEAVKEVIPVRAPTSNKAQQTEGL